MFFYTDLPDHIHSIDGVVYMRVIAQFRSISNVNTVGQEFDCKLWFQVKWMINIPYESVDLDNEWQPMIEVLNNHGKLSQEQCVMVKKFKAAGLTAIYSNYIFQGTFSEQFNLQQFPLDNQQLNVCFTMWGCPILAKTESRLFVSSQNLSVPEFKVKKMKVYTRPKKNKIFDEEFIPCEIWHRTSPILIWQGENQGMDDAGKVAHSTLEFSFIINRKLVFYFINILLPTFIIVLSAISSRMLSTFESQQNLVYTLMLTIVSLKFATVSFIPKTSVITYLDKYSLVSFIWVTISALHNIVMHLLHINDKYSKDIISKIDQAIIIWQLCAWVIFHVGIVSLLSKHIRGLISHHVYHINRRKRVLVMTGRYDKDDSNTNNKVTKGKTRFNHLKSEFPIVAFPLSSSTSALSCINGTVTDNKYAGAFNKQIVESANYSQSSKLPAILENNDLYEATFGGFE